MREADLLIAARVVLPRPTPSDVVAHSPTPSIVRMAASSNGDGIEGARRVRFVVLGKQHLLIEAG